MKWLLSPQWLSRPFVCFTPILSGLTPSAFTLLLLLVDATWLSSLPSSLGPWYLTRLNPAPQLAPSHWAIHLFPCPHGSFIFSSPELSFSFSPPTPTPPRERWHSLNTARCDVSYFSVLVVTPVFSNASDSGMFYAFLLLDLSCFFLLLAY